MTKHTLFRATKTETKAEATTSVAKNIIASETSAREAKVERLRKARLERERGRDARRRSTGQAPQAGRGSPQAVRRP
ncbi:MAG: hypothetical protein MUF63_15975 [Rhodobacteraceae bacterium]|nr:hypothetical protein [Paracoccaceae bacterium]